MPLNVMTFGSCMSGFVANCLRRLSPEYRVVSTVQHTRIDQFLGPRIFKRDTTFVPAPKCEPFLLNQLSDERLGKSLPYGLPEGTLVHPDDAMASGVDVLLIDNYADALFLAYRNPETGQMLYANPNQMLVMDPAFSELVYRVPVTEAIAGYQQLLGKIRSSRRTAVAVFMNFPLNRRAKPAVDQRSWDFEEASTRLWETPGFGVLDLVNLTERDTNRLDDPDHFTVRRYTQYAFQAHGLIQLLRTRPAVAQTLPRLFNLAHGRAAQSTASAAPYAAASQ